MKTIPSLQSILAGVAAGSLLIYVLACATSFSPDDRQVLYPSFDPPGGAASVAVYDRKTGRSETVYAAATAAAATNQSSTLMRAGWLPDGRHILVLAYFQNAQQLDVLVLPHGVRDPVRHFSLNADDDAESYLIYPFAVAGSDLFLNGDNRDPVRLNLVTGVVTGGKKATNELHVLPSPDGKSLVGWREVSNGNMEGGTFDPQTGQFTPLGQTGTNLANSTLPAFNPADGRLIFVADAGDQLQLRVVKNGRTEFTRPLARDDAKLQTGPFLDLARDGKTVLTAYSAVPAGTTNSECGLLEIPLSNAPLRFTPLFHAGTEPQLLSAQPSLSHDGRTWAISTACLYLQDPALPPQDCALFLVDLSKSSRPVTKVPIQAPPTRKPLMK